MPPARWQRRRSSSVSGGRLGMGRERLKAMLLLSISSDFSTLLRLKCADSYMQGGVRPSCWPFRRIACGVIGRVAVSRGGSGRGLAKIRIKSNFYESGCSLYHCVKIIMIRKPPELTTALYAPSSANKQSPQIRPPFFDTTVQYFELKWPIIALFYFP